MEIRRLITFIFIVAGLSNLFAGAFLHYFHAKSEGENVVLTWETGEEANITEYVILRGVEKEQMVEIAVVKPKGSNSNYKFTDESAYKTNDSFYIYQLKILDGDGSETFSNHVSVSHRPSSVKRTWGSIKALFR